MIEPSGTKVSLPPNRQSMVPMASGMGQSQKHVVQQAQDDSGFGGLSNAGIADMVPGKTQRLDDCVTQGQDSGSHQAAVPGGGNLNKGDKGAPSVDFVSPHFSSSKAPNRTFGNKDIGVEGSSASQGALIANPGLAD